MNVMMINDIRIRKSCKEKKIGGYVNIEKEYKKKKHTEKEDDKDDKQVKFRFEAIYDSLGVLKNGTEIWNNMLEQVKKYIKENNKLPSTIDKNKKIKKMGNWIGRQKKNYEKRQYNMKNEEIRNEWIQFINEYEEYFKSNDEIWNETLDEVKKYIKENNKLPSSTDKNKEIKKMGNWIGHQKTNYGKRQYNMKNEEIRNEWIQFINEYL